MEKSEVVVAEELILKNRIRIVRGVPVIFDYDLAEIYGYSTKAFNQQVKNNANRFPADFRFRLTRSEVEALSRSNFLTSIQTEGVKGGRTTPPFAFTEQGVYMLMTVLRGELAIRQSITLIRLFKQMKDVFISGQPLISQNGYASVMKQIEEHTADIKEIKDTMVSKADLSDFMKLFDSSRDAEELLILNGQLFSADMTYQKIYRKAKKSIIVIDDYLGAKTLRHLASAKKKVSITVISDNKGNQPLRKQEYDDFSSEYAGRGITFIKTANKVHDRYIVLDYGTAEMKVFLCGSSSKDAGKKITTVLQVKDVSEYKTMIKMLLSNQPLALR